MQNPRRRLQNWINEIQSKLGVVSVSLQQAERSLGGARELFELSTHEFRVEQMRAIEQIEVSLGSGSSTIRHLLDELEKLRAELDRLVE